MNDAERIWREKSDVELLEAAAELDQFTDEGQRVIRAELKRRGLEDPVEQAGSDPVEEAGQEPLECLRCSTPLRPIEDVGGRGVAVFGPLVAYSCPRCGHVELFTEVQADDEEGETGA